MHPPTCEFHFYGWGIVNAEGTIHLPKATWKQKFALARIEVNGCTGIRLAMMVSVVVGLALMQAACINLKPANPSSVVAKKSTEATGTAITNMWLPLAKDNLHDPDNPGIHLLQEPSTALATLPANFPRVNVGSFRTPGVRVNMDGNKVDWVRALKESVISPRRSKTPGTGVEREELVMDMDMFLDMAGSMPIVRFPHLAHTMWLACSNCHPAIFIPQAGANLLSMEAILSGEQCGICHRAVSFPPTDCARCHSVGHNTPEGMKIKSEARAKAKERARVAEELAATIKAKTKAQEEASVKTLPPLPEKGEIKAKKQKKKVEARP